MRLLVAGGAGFIGAHWIRRRLASRPGDRVINLDALTYAAVPESLRDVERDFPERYRFERGDIADQDAVRALLLRHEPDAVVNFAAESHNSRGLLGPRRFFESNVLGPQTLAQLAHETGGRRLHHVSTCEVYGPRVPGSATPPFDERAPLQPTTPYASSKAGGDLAVLAWHRTFGLPVTISRGCNTVGPAQFPEKVVPLFSIRALRGADLPMYASTKNAREWMDVSDHCSGIDAALDRGEPGGVYNLGTGEERTIEQIADLVLAELGLPSAQKRLVPDRPGHDAGYLLDCARARDELGWAPTLSADDAVRGAVRWCAEHEEWWAPLLRRLDVDESRWGG